MDFCGHDLTGLDRLDVAGRLKWVSDRFPSRAGIGTSFQHSGMLLIDLCARHRLNGIRIYTVDTERLLPETYSFIKTVEAHYGIAIEVHRPDPGEVRTMVDQHGLYLFFDSKEKQEYCCNLRKVKPNDRVMEGLDVWVTGLRRAQSDYRSTIPLYEVIDRGGRAILKLNPLFDWTDQQIEDHVKANKVPVHPLYAQGYPSFGCVICTTPIRPGEDSRAGRWRWFSAIDSKKECGLHLPEKR